MMAADWSQYNLPAILAMMEGENDCRRADRVVAWESLAQSVREQHRRLTAVSQELAAVWSTDTDSAKAFQRQIEGLAQSMMDTLQCAEDTRIGYRDVVNTLGDATGKLFKLSLGRAEVSVDIIPRQIDGAEDEYDEKAQQVMREAEAAIAVQSTNIKAPALYRMEDVQTPGGDTIFLGDELQRGHGSGASGVGAIPIPVPIPHDPVQLEPSTRTRVSADAITGIPADPSLGLGPGLSGVTPQSTAPLPGSGAISPGQALGPGQPLGPGAPIGSLGGEPLGLAPPTNGLGVVPGMGGLPGRGGTGAGWQAVPMRRGLPSGAVIGQSPINAGDRGIAGTHGIAGQMPLGGAGSRGRRDGSDHRIDGNADEHWEAYEGVAPVIAPDVTPTRRDPGPGVLGIDR